MNTFTTIKTKEASDGVFEITLSRPEKLNALNDLMLAELDQAFQYAKAQQSIKGLLISGEGKAFCAGADINRLAKADAIDGLAFAHQGQQVFRSLEQLNKPSLAAINGYAFGGGCELSMAATLRTASENAQFGQPEVKLGVIPGYGGTQRLARLIGKGRAIDLCITGRFIDAKTAYDWGLITLLTDPDTLLTKSRALLLMAIQQAPIAVASAIQAIDQGFNLSLDQALELEALIFASTCATQDKQEGTQAFLEKRAPLFKGR